MSEEEMKEAARLYAEIILDAVERKMGGLPPPPSEEEFHRLWEEHVMKPLKQKQSLPDTDTTHTQQKA